MNTIKNGWDKEGLEEKLVNLRNKYQMIFASEKQKKKMGNHVMAKVRQRELREIQNQIDTVNVDLKELAINENATL